MKSGDAQNREVRIAIWVSAAILLTVAAIQLYLSFYLDPYLGKRLKATVKQETQGRYELQFKDLQLSLFKRNLQIENADLKPSDSSSLQPEIRLGLLDLEGIGILSYLMNGKVSVKHIRLTNPELTLIEGNIDSTFQRLFDTSSDSKSGFPGISVDRLNLENGTIELLTTDRMEMRGKLEQLNITITDIRVDSSIQSQVPYFSYGKAEILTGGINYQLSNDLYTLQSDRFGYSGHRNIAFLDSLKLIPSLPKYKFSQQVGTEIDRVDLDLPRLELQNIDIFKLLEHKLDAEKLLFVNGRLEVFHDKKMPAGAPTERTFPHMVFKNLGLTVLLDTVAVRNAQISYAEHLPGVPKPGMVTFAGLDAIFYDVTNDSLKINRGHSISADIRTKLMGAAPLNIEVNLPMNGEGTHHLSGRLDSMQVNKLNPILERVGLFKAEKGIIHSLEFDINLGTEEARGWVLLEYSDLNIEVLDRENLEEGGTQKLQTFLVNALKIKSQNNKEPLRKGKVLFKRNPEKSIFHYWWKSLSSGLKDTIGI